MIIDQNVLDAAAWLDGNFPGWERKVDVSTLDIINCRECILGQALRDLGMFPCNTGYNVGIAFLDRQFGNRPAFVAAFVSSKYELNWIELLKERFNSGNLSDES